MKKFLFSMLSVVMMALMVTSCAGKRSYETVDGDPMQSRIYTLDNGLKVYLTVNKETPRIQTYIPVRVGGKNDPAETTGLAHYFEHLMFKGSESFGTQNYAEEKPLLDQIEALFEVYRTKTDEAERTAIYRVIDSLSYEASKLSIPNEYDKLMAAIGADGTNAYTSFDVTCYIEDIPSNQLENWAKIQADRFKYNVIRGFHTELETVYEEKNMSLTRDSRKLNEAMFSALFKNHPYGTQTVLGTQEHLKNPSITNIKNYYKKWYVPNNMAICMSGDFDFDEAMDIIEKYFGDMQPNEELQMLSFEPEAEITEPIVKEVWGLESERVALAWRFPGAASDEALMLGVIDAIMSNGKAGLIDLNLMQQQQLLSAGSFSYDQTDYTAYFMQGAPKAGQSLEEVRDLLLAQIDALRKGEWDESLLAAGIANYKLQVQKMLENNDSRADLFVQAFVNGIEWADIVNRVERTAKITKEDVLAFANEHLKDNNYAIVYKRQGQDPNVKKIAKPAITPIFMNRDTTSAFLREVQASVVAPIEPVFVDFSKEMSKGTIGQLPLLYKKNEMNDLFTLQYIFDFGANEMKALSTARNYLDYLGTSDMTAAEIKQAFYNLACNYRIGVSNTQVTISLSGLSENMNQAIALLEKVITDAQPNQAAYDNLVADVLKSRANSKANQNSNFNMLRQYGLYGANNPSKHILSESELRTMKPETLIDAIAQLPTYEHRVLYYGPMTMAEVSATVGDLHKVPATLKAVEKNETFQYQRADENIVYIAPYDANQIYMSAVSNQGEQYSLEKAPIITLYNEYFGGGMNSIVFQEMREARGLAYSSSARMIQPWRLEDPAYYWTYIATQNDKMIDALTAFDEIINNMPVSEQAFAIAKESLIGRLRTERITRDGILSYYLSQEHLGLTEDTRRQLYEAVQTMTLDDVVAYQQANVKDRKYITCILGREADLDMQSLENWGKIIRLTQEDIFGY
ncbi:MAG: insulinase family protein [Bacteroidaceae bacterium]|nr:insulinase family protein [Bacteroidaceae bacterium]MBR5842783.1 insulinase family protein [Bacteroidaceae bacterium]